MTSEVDPVPVLDRGRTRWPVYAERTRRRTRQFVADVAVLTWVAVVVSLAILLHDAVLALQGPGRQLGGAGQTVRDTFTGAADTASNLPFVGDDLARALSTGTQAGDSLVAAGDQEVAAIDALASGLAWALVLLAVVPVVATWITLRVRWMLSARAVLLLRDGLGRAGWGGAGSGHEGADADLLALRALAFASPRRLSRAVPGAASGWRRGDPHVLARLAELELGRLGLRGPTLVRGPAVAVASAPVPDEPDTGSGIAPGTDGGARPGTLPRVDPDEGWGDTPPPPGPSGPHTS
ncbi:hypothetical protein [Actinomycetospora chlora]|uniref:hypothetical protein n=1 Tax=Actinomycetospora chlora TaxID=663608 RepID=UPI0031E6BCD3